MWHGALSNECKWNLSWDWKTQCIVLHNLPFPSTPHSHHHKSFMTKINDLSFSDSLCSLFLGTVFYLFSRGYLEFKLLLSTCLCIVLFIAKWSWCQVPAWHLWNIFLSAPWEYMLWPFQSQEIVSTYEVAWPRLKWTEKLSASVSFFGGYNVTQTTELLMINFERKNMRGDLSIYDSIFQ